MSLVWRRVKDDSGVRLFDERRFRSVFEVPRILREGVWSRCDTLARQIRGLPCNGLLLKAHQEFCAGCGDALCIWPVFGRQRLPEVFKAASSVQSVRPLNRWHHYVDKKPVCPAQLQKNEECRSVGSSSIRHRNRPSSGAIKSTPC